MLIRQDFTPELPPKAYLLQVAGDVAKVYCYLWEQKDKEFSCDVKWVDIAKIFSKNTFRTCVRKLHSEGLLNYDENATGSSIELTGWSE